MPVLFSYHRLKRLVCDNTTFQFAVVHYFTKYGSGECYFSSDLSSDSSSDDEDRTQGKGRRRPTDSVRQQNYKSTAIPHVLYVRCQKCNEVSFFINDNELSLYGTTFHSECIITSVIPMGPTEIFTRGGDVQKLAYKLIFKLSILFLLIALEYSGWINDFLKYL